MAYMAKTCGVLCRMFWHYGQNWWLIVLSLSIAIAVARYCCLTVVLRWQNVTGPWGSQRLSFDSFDLSAWSRGLQPNVANNTDVNQISLKQLRQLAWPASDRIDKSLRLSLLTPLSPYDPSSLFYSVCCLRGSLSLVILRATIVDGFCLLMRIIASDGGGFLGSDNKSIRKSNVFR